MRSPIAWVGGKSWQLPIIRPLFDGKRRLVELFCGSCAIAFGLEPEGTVLNDANPHLINFWRWWQSGLQVTFRSTTSAEYHDRRDRFNELAQLGARTAEAARAFYYLNCFGFNNLWRTNQRGEFNVPPRPRLDARGPFTLASDNGHHRWDFTVGDFGEVRLRPDDFVYADPPYDDGFTGYTADRFSFEDQERLAMLLAGHPGPVAITNKATQRIVKLYDALGYRLEYLDSKQVMHRSRGRTDAVLEVLALRNV